MPASARSASACASAGAGKRNCAKLPATASSSRGLRSRGAPRASPADSADNSGGSRKPSSAHAASSLLSEEVLSRDSGVLPAGPAPAAPDDGAPPLPPAAA
eukprot:129550-Chlamydomonas_euryale.AAC.2